MLLFRIHPCCCLPSLLLSHQKIVHSSEVRYKHLRLHKTSHLPEASDPSKIFSKNYCKHNQTSHEYLYKHHFQNHKVQPQQAAYLRYLPLSQALFLPDLCSRSYRPCSIHNNYHSVARASCASAEKYVLHSPDSLPESYGLTIGKLSGTLPSDKLLHQFLPYHAPLYNAVHHEVRSHSSSVNLYIQVFLTHHSSPE